MTKPTIEEIEPLALEFAKSLIANNEVPNAKLSEKSIELALQWYEEKALRERWIEKLKPNWIDLRELQSIEFLDGNFNNSNNYWMLEESPISTGFAVIYGKLRQATYYPDADNVDKARANYKSPRLNQVRFILTTEESAKFDENFQPNPPHGIELAPGL